MHTNTSTQTNQRYTCSKKKIKKHRDTQTHTHTQTNPNGQTTKRQINAYRNDRCLTGTIGAHGSCLIGARGYGSCLIGARELGRSVLVIEIGACDCDRDACDQDGVDRSL